MPTEMLDINQIEKNTKKINEIIVNIQALLETIKEYFKKILPEDNDFEETFIQKANKIRGVDIKTNLNIGKVILTKYNKTIKPKRWEIYANNNNESIHTN